jgi:hypothetical protein
MELSENLIKLVGYLAWPVTAIFACLVFYKPLSRLVETLGRRITKFSIFKVDIELDRLTKAVSLGATVERLRQVAVTESGLAPIVAGVAKSGSADYLVVNIGDDGDEWLTSRLFLLAAILERSRAVRCVVFLEKADRFVGAATARDIRSSLGAHYLAYEAAFAAAYGNLPPDQNMFRRGLNEALINHLSNSFLRNMLISQTYMPGPASGWVELQHEGAAPPSWEFADWITAASLKDLLGQHLLTESVVADTGRVSPQTTKSLVKSSGPLVALVSSDRVFKEICDRYAVLESVAREAVEQSVDPP